jgi:hypothetical protein
MIRASVGITSRLQIGDSNMPPTTTQGKRLLHLRTDAGR